MTGEFSYLRYLEAKGSVDDRALNRMVVDALRQRLPTGRPLRILELGGGTGSMIRRCLSWSLLGDAEYHLVDQDAEAIAALPGMLKQWAEREAKIHCEEHPSASMRLRHSGGAVALHLVQAEMSELLSRDQPEFDLVIANAVLDLVDLSSLLPKLWARASANAHFWFTINFDGESIFLPPLAGDSEIFEAYHASMDRRTGTRYTGRSLFAALDGSGATLLESGSSDWVVHAAKGLYRHDEAYFLRHIIHTIEEELRDHPKLDASLFAAWVAARHQQVDKGELVYIAHQLDFFGSAPGEEKG